MEVVLPLIMCVLENSFSNVPIADMHQLIIIWV